MTNNDSIVVTEEEIKKELGIVFDSQICRECEQDHSFKNNFENVKTSMDDFLNIRNRIWERAVPFAGYDVTMVES